MKRGRYLAMGIALGCGVGVALHNIGLGLGLGVLLGTILTLVKSRKPTQE